MKKDTTKKAKKSNKPLIWKATDGGQQYAYCINENWKTPSWVKSNKPVKKSEDIFDTCELVDAIREISIRPTYRGVFGGGKLSLDADLESFPL